jgi:glycine/serine hydroxymethyltransferase
MGMHAPAYASATVRNARRLAAALVSHGFDVVNRDGVATESGTFWLRPPPGSDNRAACRLLMRAGILTNARKLGPSEVLRIATHYVTRLGMGTEEMDAIGDAFARVLLHGVPADHVQREVRDLMAAHTDIAFSFDALLDATTRHTPDRGWTT